jgi:hypothetical protein
MSAPGRIRHGLVVWCGRAAGIENWRLHQTKVVASKDRAVEPCTEPVGHIPESMEPELTLLGISTPERVHVLIVWYRGPSLCLGGLTLCNRCRTHECFLESPSWGDPMLCFRHD